ncbi:AarF/UbiB family protein [Butyrivibrio sp. DSM 10294]|uniref:AarF/UbiB family protein n=1 Tax=Butyrivibrio sp. DSM 10294 TaxID=2972457 RepID=UPI00234E8B51|nr:AarF/UbiB family protein [Butyrivibrio sp. DSM 10294]MDC7293979.1 AarF/UbiB family protein [Butyrivibrio sp. DSM 10294]
MPNDELQVRRELSQKEQFKIDVITQESESFRAVNLDLKQNADYKQKSGYNVEQTSESVRFIDEMLTNEQNGIIEMSPEQRALIIMQRSRYKSFMQLNDGKFSGDSKEMQAVKKHLGILEDYLQTRIAFNEQSFHAIEHQYDNVIKVCTYYVNNKNPWFRAGIERKQRVQETLMRMQEEKSVFLAARDAYKNNPLEAAKYTNVRKMMEAHLANSFKEAKKSKPVEKEDNGISEVDKEWLEDLKEQRNFNAFFENLKSQNPYITEEDAEYHLMLDVLKKHQSYDKEKHKEKLPPMLDGLGEANEIVKEAEEKGVASDGDVSRKVTNGLRVVRRDKTGKPRTEEDRIRDEQNKEYLALFKDYYDAKAVKKQAGNEPSEDVLTSFETKKKKLWDCCIKRIEYTLARVNMPTPQELKKNPNFIDDIRRKDFDLYYAIHALAGWWSELGNEGMEDYQNAYIKEHPEFHIFTDMLTNLKMIETSVIRPKHHMNASMELNTKDDYTKYMNVMNNPNATQDEKNSAQLDYDDSMRQLQEDVDELIEQYEENYIKLKQYEAIKDLSWEEKKAYIFFDEIKGTKTPEQIIEEQQAEGKNISLQAAKVHLLIKNALKTEHLPEYNALKEKFHKQNNNGAMSREVGSLLYLVLKKDNDEPLNEEEKKKQEWNKKWLECYADENKRQDKVELMKEAIPRILNTEIPSPEQIKAHGLGYYFEKDPVKFIELANRVTGLSNLKGVEPDLFKEVVPTGSLIDERWNVLTNFSVYVLEYVTQFYLLNKDNNYDFYSKEKVDEKNSPGKKAVEKQVRASCFSFFEESYNGLKKREANEKLTKEQIRNLFKKSDRVPTDLSKIRKSADNKEFLREHSVEDAKKEADLIDKILRGENTESEAKNRLYDENGATVEQYLDETKEAINKLGVKTVTGLKHKQILDMAHVLLNSNEKEDSAEMDSVKQDLTAIADVMEKNKNLEAESKVIEEFDVAIHLAITSCKHYLNSKNPHTEIGQKRYQIVYEIWSSLICEQRLIMYAYNSATESKLAGNPVTLGQLFGMTETNRKKKAMSPEKSDEVQTEDVLEKLYNFGKQKNAPGPGKLSKEAEYGKKILGPGHIFIDDVKNSGLSDKAKKARAQKILEFRTRIKEFPKGQVCSADLDILGTKVRVLQKSDNTLYVIDNHKEIPVGNKTFDSINNQIEQEIFNNPEIYGDKAVSDLIAHYRSNDMTSGEHLRVRQAMIEFICGKTGMVPNEFSNVVKSALADFTLHLIKGEITPEEVTRRVRDEINKGEFVNGVELAEMVELTRNRSKDQLDQMVVLQSEQVQVERPMEEGWTAEEKKVKDFVADFIFSQETWEMDASISRPEGFVADMIRKHAPAVLALVNAKKKGQNTVGLVEGIMEKMSLSELDGELNGERVKLAAVVKDAINSLTDLVEAQLSRFNEGGDLAGEANLTTDEARLSYIFDNMNADMRQQLAGLKESMDAVADKAGAILQQNVNKMTNVIFPEQQEGQEKDLSQQSLKEILSGATKSEKGQGKLIRNVLKNYFGKVSNLDKRAMLASVIRNAKKVSVDDLTDTVIIAKLKAEKPAEYAGMFGNPDKLNAKEREAIEEYRNAKKELRMQSNFLAGLLRGAGPLMHKLMQGIPAQSLPPEIAEALKDMKTNLPPIPDEIVRTRFAAMVESSGGTVTKIEKIKSLGAASVGQAFLCKVYGPGMKPEGEEVVIKLLRPEASNRMKREEAIMLECAAMTDEAMKATYEGQLNNYRKELDLSVEAENCRKGQKAYKEEMEKLPEEQRLKDVKTMSVFEEIPATSNALVIKKVEGDTLDSYINDLKKFSEDAGEKAHVGRPDLPIRLNSETEKTVVSIKKELLDKIDNAVKRRDHLLGLVNVWITQAVCKTGFYHGDLHAGNVMINDEDATFIDYGNAVQLSERQQANIAKMTLAASLSVVKKYKEVTEEITKNGKTKTVTRTVYDTEKMNKINDESVDLFFESFNDMLAESNDEAENAAYTNEKKAQVRDIFKTVLQKGNENDTGARIAAAILKVQEIGVKVPPAMQNFSQGQIRLQNSINELNEAIDDMHELATKLDNAFANNTVKDPVYVVQSKISEEHRQEDDNEADAAFEHALKEIQPLDEDEFVKAVLDDQYKQGDQELGIRTIDKRLEFDQFYFKGVLDLKQRYNEQDEDVRTNYENIRDTARSLVTDYLNKYRSKRGTKEQLDAANKLSSDLLIELAYSGLFDAFGGMSFMLNGLQTAMRTMDEDYLNDFLNAVDKLFPLALTLQEKLNAIRNEQDGIGGRKASKEKLTSMAKELYKDFAKIWDFGVKRNKIRAAIEFDLNHPSNTLTEANLKEIMAITEKNVGQRVREKLDNFFAIKKKDITIDEGGKPKSFDLSPENAEEFIRAKNELLDVVMEGVAIRLKNFKNEMHNRKPNFKFVNYDTVMTDVVSNNQKALTKKVGFANALWAAKVVGFM